MAYKALILTAILLMGLLLVYPGSQSGQVSQHLYTEYTADMHSVGLYTLLNDTSLNPEAFQLAYMGYRSLVAKGSARKENVITIIDYSRPSCEERFYVIDPLLPAVIFKTLVAHGRNSGDLYARNFSNRPQSHQSALGFYITDSPYHGGQGYSLMINGVDTGFNDNARKRSIVIHAADYVSGTYIERYGRLGRSFGCPALPEEVNASIIDLIKDGSVVFCYYPDDQYIRNSKVLGGIIRESLAGLWF